MLNSNAICSSWYGDCYKLDVPNKKLVLLFKITKPLVLSCVFLLLITIIYPGVYLFPITYYLKKLKLNKLKDTSLNRYYEAIVDDILPESETVAVKFIELDKSDVCQISALKPVLTDTSKSTAGTSQTHLKNKAALK